MAFVKRDKQASIGKYAYISKGMIVTGGGDERQEYDAIRGHVLALDIEQDEYEGKEYEKLVLYIKDSEAKETVLSFPLISGYGIAFCSLAKNVKWSKPVEISASSEKKDGKSRVSLFIKQPNEMGKWENIKWAYTAANPGKMPPPTEGTDRNGKFMDFSKRNAFFRKLLVDFVYKEMRKAYPDFDLNKAKEKKNETAAAADITEPIDDLPF